MKRIKLTAPQQIRIVHAIRWLAVGTAGLLAFLLTWFILEKNLHLLRISTVTFLPQEMSFDEYYELEQRTFAYRLELFDMELVRENNTHGRDTRAEFERLRIQKDWLLIFAGLVPGVIVAGMANTFLRAAIRKRIQDANQ